MLLNKKQQEKFTQFDQIPWLCKLQSDMIKAYHAPKVNQANIKSWTQALKYLKINILYSNSRNITELLKTETLQDLSMYLDFPLNTNITYLLQIIAQGKTT